MIDHDDESSAQMNNLREMISRYSENVVQENIGEMWMTYMYDATTKDGQCKPIMRLFDEEVTCIINQYPKEWLVNEVEHDELLKYDLAEIRSFEPWWKLILGNKALLPMLWSEFPNHPNLLPAFFDDPRRQIDFTGTYSARKDEVERMEWVSKPLFGREGIGILKSNNFSSMD